MRELLNRRTDQPLPPGQHERLRAELLDAIESEQAGTPRRVLVPAAAAAAVLLVAAGLAVAVPALRNNDAGTAVAGQGQPAVRDLSEADTAALQKQCLAEADRITVKQLPKPFRSYKPVHAFEFVDVNDPKVVKTWLIAKGLPGYWLCSRTAGGQISESSLSIRGDGAEWSMPLRGLARNAGIFMNPVVRVTLQQKGHPATDAHLYHGFWFAPTVGRVGWGPYDADDPDQDDFVYRGYDANGKEIYSSTTTPEPCTARVNIVHDDGTREPAPGPANPSPPYCKRYKWTF
ncbi:hypothetical protein OG474_13210 [Kribbella sp. NBC_01505]|uniref:hypothetical protein n=1 Tax=Kribbella sp. NBC_01505 TaxID=2903580 RepID=UPI00386C6C24